MKKFSCLWKFFVFRRFFIFVKFSDVEVLHIREVFIFAGEFLVSGNFSYWTRFFVLLEVFLSRTFSSPGSFYVFLIGFSLSFVFVGV
jgi:hypothetical protein